MAQEICDPLEKKKDLDKQLKKTWKLKAAVIENCFLCGETMGLLKRDVYQHVCMCVCVCVWESVFL